MSVERERVGSGQMFPLSLVKSLET